MCQDPALGLGAQHHSHREDPGRRTFRHREEYQVDPVKGTLLHVDLLRVAMDVRMRVKVPVHVFGEAQGVKLQGGVFEMVIREVEIECLRPIFQPSSRWTFRI